MWKKLGTSVLLSHKRLVVVEDKVVLPNGEETKYIRFEGKTDSVTAICQREDKKILLLSEYSYPPNQWMWEFPGGSINANEESRVAVNRELMEEANLFANKLVNVGEYLIDNRRSDARMHVFYATQLEARSREKDIEEEFILNWFSLFEIEELIRLGKIDNCHVLAPLTLLKSGQYI